MPEDFSEADAAAEIERLRAKQSTIDDEDIRLALQARIDSLESELVRRKKPAEEPAEDPTPKATPEQERQADQLIRQAKVEKMRGNKDRASTLLREASAIAPGSPTVLEAVGDDLLERRMMKDAKMVYQRALKLDPRNVGIERKLAMCALRVGAIGSIEDQLRSGLSDPMFITSSDNVASLNGARFLNAIIPGVGHMVLGRTGAGLAMLLVFGACIGMIALLHKDVPGVLRMIYGKESHPHMLVLLPMCIALIVWVGAQAALGLPAARPAVRKHVDRPVPPVDLPFE